MDAVFQDFRTAHHQGNGALLASTLSTDPSSRGDSQRLQAFWNETNAFEVNSDIKYYVSKDNAALKIKAPEANCWAEVYIAYWKCLDLLSNPKCDANVQTHTRVYETWKEVANALIRGYTNGGFEAWTVPCLYVAANRLRSFAIKADAAISKQTQIDSAQGKATLKTDDLEDGFASEQGGNEKLEDAARVINRMFTLCISDRAPLKESRKWGLYYIINQLFKTYFKLNSISLSKNILRALHASQTEMPPLTAFPKSHIVTFKYYVGVISFLEENYPQAEENLYEAWKLCRRGSTHNQELILTYLIPTRMLTTNVLFSPSLLRPFPWLNDLLMPLWHAIRTGNLRAFDLALETGELEFVRRRIYLTLERARDLCLRNLFRKVFLLGGFETGKGKEEGQQVRRTRIPLKEFVRTVELIERRSEGEIEREEVECMLAGLIYKNFIKGYISREAAMVVLSKTGAFPGTGV